MLWPGPFGTCNLSHCMNLVCHFRWWHCLHTACDVWGDDCSWPRRLLYSVMWCYVMSCSLKPTTRLHSTTSQNTAVFMVLAVMNYGDFKAQARYFFLLLSGCSIYTNKHLDKASNKNTVHSSLCHHVPSLKDKHQHNRKRLTGRK